MRISHPDMISVNDVKAIAKDSFIATNDFLFPHESQVLRKLQLFSTMGLNGVVRVDFNDQSGTVNEVSTVAIGFHQPNGVNFDNGTLVINDAVLGEVHIFDWDTISQPVLNAKVKLNYMAADNVNFDQNGDILVAGFVQALKTYLSKDHTFNSAGVRISKDTLQLSQIYFQDLTAKYGAATIATYENLLFIGSPYKPLHICTIGQITKTGKSARKDEL